MKVGDWHIPGTDEHFGPMLKEGGYQSANRQRALRHVKKFGVAFDIGAHIGTWSREFSERFQRVYAWEPVEEHRKCFNLNVLKDNVVLEPVALGETFGSCSMETFEGNTGAAHTIDGGDVTVRALDSYGFLTCDFMKLDVESDELLVLKGATETILRCKPIICIEQSAHRWRGTQYDAAEYLESLGAVYLERVGSKDHVFGWDGPGKEGPWSCQST